jgi:hypothetical protein
MTPCQQNTLIFIGLFLGVSVISWLVAALIGAHAGEAAGALGSVVGGAIGALGAAAAVYLTLQAQRHDEAEKISIGIVMEVAMLAKFPLEQLATIRLIYSGAFRPAREQLSTLMQTPPAVIYPSNAEHIGRAHRPVLIVSFYTGLAETDATVNVITNGPGPNLGPNDVEGLGIILREQCVLARQILATAPAPKGNDKELMTQMIVEIIRMLDEEIESSRRAFPSIHAYQQRTRVPSS